MQLVESPTHGSHFNSLQFRKRMACGKDVQEQGHGCMTKEGVSQAHCADTTLGIELQELDIECLQCTLEGRRFERSTDCSGSAARSGNPARCRTHGLLYRRLSCSVVVGYDGQLRRLFLQAFPGALECQAPPTQE